MMDRQIDLEIVKLAPHNSIIAISSHVMYKLVDVVKTTRADTVEAL